MTLYDHRGEPIRPTELTREPQTAKLEQLHREYAEHPSSGLTPPKLAAILRAGEEGDLVPMAQLAEDMEEKDAHLYADVSKRKRAILGDEWDVVPPKNATAAEKKEAERVREVLESLDIETVILDAADAILKGYSCLEITWERSGREWRPSAIEHRPADWFMARPERRNRLRLRTLDGQGEELRPFGWIVHESKAKSGYLTRGGLARVLAWPFLFRNYSLRDLAEFLEIYGLPLRLGKYQPGATDQEKATLLRAVVNIGHAAAGIIPEGMAIEFKEAATGAADPFMAMIEHAEKAISKAVLGATLTSQTDGGGGAYALGNVHNEIRHDILISDARQLAQTLTRDLVRPLTLLNSSVDRAPRFEFLTEEYADLRQLAEILPEVGKVFDLRVSRSWFHKKFRIPEAADDDDVLPMREAPQRDAALSDVAALAEETGSEGDEPDFTDNQVAQLQKDTAPIIGAWVERVRALLDEVSSVEEFRDRLLEVTKDLDAAELAAVMAQAFTAAQLAGRLQVLEDLDA